MSDRIENWARTITDAVVALPDIPYSQKQEIKISMREIGEHDCNAPTVEVVSGAKVEETLFANSIVPILLEKIATLENEIKRLRFLLPY